MTNILVLYYSSYGHVRAMAEAVAEGARSVPGTLVDIRRIPETVPQPVRVNAGYVADDTPEASPGDLANYDGILFGTPTRFGMMAGQMKLFLDQAGGLWAQNALVGKVAGVFRWKRMLESGEFATIAELAERKGIAPSYKTRVLLLALLAPDIVEAILDGEQWPKVTLIRVLEPFPVEWQQQRSHIQ